MAPAYAWLHELGWWLSGGSDARPTHLMLDGGKARVPDHDAGAFLNAYALAVVRKLQPSIVELRTPVFRMFVDLDIKTRRGEELDWERVMAVLQARAAAFFDVEQPRAVVCATDAKDCDDGCVKSGKHVVWTNILATSATALTFRAAVVEDLEAGLPDACAKPWATVVDACVFTSSGLRMPFSAKGRAGSSVYVPTHVWTGADCQAAGPVSGVSAVRQWVRELSIRTVGSSQTPVRDGVQVLEVPTTGGAHGTSLSLREYEDVLPLLDAALPPQFAGQRFTSVLKMEACFLLRSSSRYCLNLGRAHNSCGIYWVLTLKGVRQGCYCRCETTEGRKWGLCKDFRSDTWPVPDEVLKAFFGEQRAEDQQQPQPQPPAFQPAPLPSAKALPSLEAILSCSRPPLKVSKKRRR